MSREDLLPLHPTLAALYDTLPAETQEELDGLMQVCDLYLETCEHEFELMDENRLLNVAFDFIHERYSAVLLSDPKKSTEALKEAILAAAQMIINRDDQKRYQEQQEKLNAHHS